MANANAPFGLRLLQRQNDATPSFGLNMDPLKIVETNATACAKGDIMVRDASTGYVRPAVAPLGTGAPAGRDQAVGVFWGCQYLSISQGKRVVSPYWPGGADTIVDADCQVIPLASFPPARFVIQANAGPIVFADIGLNADIVWTAPTIFGSWAKSGVTLGTPTTTLGLPFRIVGLWSQYAGSRAAASGQPGTDNTTAFNWVVVEFNNFNETGQ